MPNIIQNYNIFNLPWIFQVKNGMLLLLTMPPFYIPGYSSRIPKFEHLCYKNICFILVYKYILRIFIIKSTRKFKVIWLEEYGWITPFEDIQNVGT